MNKTQLQANNAALDDCITRVNAAKDAVSALPDDGYDAFWDAYQDPAWIDCDSRFAGLGWNDLTFYPKYDIPNNPAWNTSFATLFKNCAITDLAKRMQECGVKFVWDKVSRADQMFWWATKLTRVPEIDLSNIANCYNIFATATSLVTIEKLKVSPKTTLGSAFYDCKALENIVVEGEIAYDDISFAQSTKLSKDSIESIIRHLTEDNSKFYKLTLSKKAVDEAFKDEDIGVDGSDTVEWQDLCMSAPYQWEIYLV